MFLTVMTLAATLAAQAPVAAPAPITADALAWMAGYWLACDGDGEVSETWSDPRGGLILGSTLSSDGGRTTFEFARIGPAAPDQQGAAYHAQPGGRPAVVFAAVEASTTRVVFENPANEFPQRIIYERQGDAMTARIEGRMGERQQAIDWRFRRLS